MMQEKEHQLSTLENALLMLGVINKEMLTKAETCMYLGVSESYLNTKTSQKEIPHYKKGKFCYYRRVELDEWIMEDRVITMDEINMQAQAFCMKKGGLYA